MKMKKSKFKIGDRVLIVHPENEVKRFYHKVGTINNLWVNGNPLRDGIVVSGKHPISVEFDGGGDMPFSEEEVMVINSEKELFAWLI